MSIYWSSEHVSIIFQLGHIYGWGNTTYNYLGGDASKILLEATQIIISNSDCQNSWNTYNSLTKINVTVSLTFL